MDMQDREFDELFRAKLEDLDAEPTGNVWPGIVDGLEAAKRGRARATWLSIAASVLVLMGVSALLISRQVTIPVKARAGGPVARVIPQEPESHESVKQTPPALLPVQQPRVNHIAGIAPKKQPAPVLKHADTSDTRPAPLVKQQEPLVAAVQQQQLKINNPVVPGEDVQLVVKSSINPSVETSRQADNVTAPAKLVAATAPATVKQRHKIHSFGDLVNLVVNKVDKRKDKVIEFTDDGDGDSNLTGVNLGILKIKKGE